MTNEISCRLLLLATAAFAIGVSPTAALAALGEPEASVQQEATQFQGSIKTAQRFGVRVHEIMSPTGTTVREFVGTDGNVFGIAWRGPMMPSLKLMLGNYFPAYREAAQGIKTDHRHLQLRTAELVVQMRSRLRDYSGVAYLPQRLPGGVAIGDLL